LRTWNHDLKCQEEPSGKQVDLDQEKRILQMERKAVDDEFVAPSEPGYSKVEQEFAGEFANISNKPGLMYIVVMHILDEVDNRIGSNIKDLQDHAIVVPDSSR
jgi:hypothetical protein